MLVKTILNKIEKCKSFVYDEQARFEMIHNQEAFVIEIKARKNTHEICRMCGGKYGCYDTLAARLYEYVPLWGIPVHF